MVEALTRCLLEWWDALILPVIAAILIVRWLWRQRSVVCRFLEQFRSQSGESEKLHILNSFAFGVLSFILVILFFGVLSGIGKFGLALLFLKVEDFASLRWLGLTFIGLLTALAGILSAPLALIRINATERQTRAEEEQNHIRKQEHTTGLLNQATEHIGATLDGGKHNIPVRIGGWLALERISRDDPKGYHLRIVDMICTYIRHNSFDNPPNDSSSGAKSTDGSSDGAKSAEYLRAALPRPEVHPADEDINVAIDILSDRTQERIELEHKHRYHLNLDGVNLRNVDFVRRNGKADFSGVFFRWSVLIGATLNEADLTEAVLVGADLRIADLNGTILAQADLTEANLVAADLLGANLTGANLTKADLESADLRGADFRGATVKGAKFDDAEMENTKPDKSVILEYVEKDEPLPYEEDSD